MEIDPLLFDTLIAYNKELIEVAERVEQNNKLNNVVYTEDHGVGWNTLKKIKVLVDHIESLKKLS
jgi:hypothetical protein